MDQPRVTPTPIDDRQLKAIRERVLSGFPDEASDELLDVLRGVLEGECYSVSDLRRIGQPIVDVSEGFLALTGYRRDEVLGRDLGFLMRDDTAQDEVRDVRDAIRDGRAATGMVRCYRRDGTLFWNEQRHYPVKDARGRVANVVVVQRDVTEMVHASSANDVARQLAASLGGDGAFYTYGAILDGRGRHRIVWVNDGAHALLGVAPAALQGRDLVDLAVPDDREQVRARLADLRANRGSRRDRYRMETAEGRVRWVEDFSAVSWVADEAGLVAVHGVVRDVSVERLRHLDADRLDALTGLPTRSVLEDRLDQAVRNARRHGGHAALVVLELDNFDFVHRTMAQRRGERFVQEAARRLHRALRRSDTLALLGPGRFGIVLPDLDDADAAAAVVDKLLAWVARPFEDDELRVELSASAGVAVAPGDGRRVDALAERAEAALAAARDRGGARFAFADVELERAAQERACFEADLRRAFDDDHLVLHYQPRVRLADGGVSAVEALVRWRHPTRGVLHPDDFLPGLFRAGLGDALFEWTLEHAVAQAAAWRERGTPRRVSVNVSPDLLERRDLADLVRASLERWQLHPGQLELELHEETGAATLERGAQQLEVVRRLGVRVALDDFGATATDFGQLRGLPIDAIKIDRRFVTRVGEGADAADVELLRAMVTIGHALGLTVVAEGIETVAQRDRVARLDVHEGQGYLFSRAIPCDHLVAGAVVRGDVAAAPAPRFG